MKYHKKIVLIMMTVICGILVALPLETTPYWSSPIKNTGTHHGAFFADINDDGFPEVVDVMENDVIYIYQNNQGVVDTANPWQSLYAERSVWASFGDYDNDGDLDMAVANYSLMGGRTKVFRNDNGSLIRDPVWTAVSGGGTWCDWGDVDNDGDLDLAIVDMFAYPAVFYNNRGVLENTPSWRATDYNLDFGGAWIDVDLDGDLDLAVSGINWQEPVLRVYNNTDGQLEQAASWSSQLDPSSHTGALLSAGDIDKDGWFDIATTMGGFENYEENYVYRNISGTLEQLPSWHANEGLPSMGSVLGDIDGDGFVDWAVNNMSPERGVAYKNINGSLNPNFSWQSSINGGMGIDLGDVDQDGVTYRADTLSGDGIRKLFSLSTLPIHRLEEVTVDGNLIPVSNYCYNFKSGWVSFKDPPSAGSQIVVKYYHSIDMELLLSSYYSRVHIFKNTNVGVNEEISRPSGLGLAIYPNPASGKVIEFSYITKKAGVIRANIYDCSGRKAKTLFERIVQAGYHKEQISVSLAEGTYFIRLESSLCTITKKIVIINE